MTDPRRASFPGLEYGSSNNTYGYNDSWGAIGQDENEPPRSSVPATEAPISNFGDGDMDTTTHLFIPHLSSEFGFGTAQPWVLTRPVNAPLPGTSSNQPQAEPEQATITIKQHHKSGLPKSAALDELKSVPRHKPRAIPPSTTTVNDPNTYHTHSFPQFSQLEHLPSTLPPQPVTAFDSDPSDKLFRPWQLPNNAASAYKPVTIVKRKRPPIVQPFFFSSAGSSRPSITTGPVQNTNTPGSSNYSNLTQPSPFPARTPNLGLSPQWSFQNTFTEPTRLISLLSSINNKLRTGVNLKFAPLLRDMDVTDQGGTGGEALFYREQVVFAQTGIQRRIGWRFCSEHLDLLGVLDLGRPEMGCDELEWLDGVLDVWMVAE